MIIFVMGFDKSLQIILIYIFLFTLSVIVGIGIHFMFCLYKIITNIFSFFIYISICLFLFTVVLPSHVLEEINTLVSINKYCIPLH